MSGSAGYEFSGNSSRYQGNLLKINGKSPGWLYVQLPDGQLFWVMTKYTANIPTGKGMTSEEVTVNPYGKNLLELEEKPTSRDNKTKNINLGPECHTSSIKDMARYRARDAKEDDLAILERFIWFSAIAACFCIVTLCAYAIFPLR